MLYLNTAKELHRHGYKVYVFGSAVRDSFLGCLITEHNLVTNAPIEKTKEILASLALFREHPTKKNTFVDDEATVTVTVHLGTIENFLSKCLFTINAMAKTPVGVLIDPYNGQDDIKNRRLATILPVSQLIEDDVTVLVRGISLSVRYNLTLSEEFVSSLNEYKHRIREGSKQEYLKLFNDLYVRGFMSSFMVAALNLGVLSEIFPFLEGLETLPLPESYGGNSVLGHIIECMRMVEKRVNKDFFWVALLHDVGKREKDYVTYEHNHELRSLEVARQVLKEWNPTNVDHEKILSAIEFHDLVLQPLTHDKIREHILAIRRYGEGKKDVQRNLVSLFVFIVSNSKARSLDHYKSVKLNIDASKALFLETLSEMIFDVDDIAVTRKDLRRYGLTPEQIPVFLEECVKNGVWRKTSVIRLLKEKRKEGAFL